MQLTIDIKESAVDKIMYLLTSLKKDVTIVSKEPLDIEEIKSSEKDFEYMQIQKSLREKNQKEYQTFETINWD